jgi:hypothetical protein
VGEKTPRDGKGEGYSSDVVGVGAVAAAVVVAAGVGVVTKQRSVFFVVDMDLLLKAYLLGDSDLLRREPVVFDWEHMLGVVYLLGLYSPSE